VKTFEVLDIGDYDASGIWRFIAMAEDISAFASHYGNKVDFTGEEKRRGSVWLRPRL
jgi:hypothetical protein